MMTSIQMTSDSPVPKTDLTVAAVVTSFEPTDRLVDVVRRAVEQAESVVVIDDGSPSLTDRADRGDREESAVRTILDRCAEAGAHVVCAPRNAGIASALNIGVRRALDAGADAVLTLDQDTLIDGDYLNRARTHLHLAASLGLTEVMVSPALINDDVAPFWFAERGLTLAFEPLQSGLVVTAELFAAIGLFDEDLFIDCVETEFYLRARERGAPALIVPGGRIEHSLGHRARWTPPRPLRPLMRPLMREGARGGTDGEAIEFSQDAPFRHYYIARNRLALYRRYGRREPLWCAVSIAKDTFVRGRAMLIGSHRPARAYLTAAGTRAALRGETGKIPKRTLLRSMRPADRARAIGERPAEPDRGLPRLVSVVIPVRNAAAVIDEQLAALAGQDYAGDFEVIVADNGSTDGLADHLADHPLADRLQLRRVDASAGRGASVARNIGVESARGDFIAFCDADDRAHPQWLTELTAVARTYSAVGGAVETDSLNAPHVQRWRGMLPPETPYEFPGFLRVSPTCNLGVWKDVFTAVGGFDTAYDRGAEDSDFTIRVQLAGGVLGHAPGALVAYRLRDTLSGLWKQSVMCGEGDVRLYSDYRSYGLPRRKWYGTLDEVAYVVLRNPLLPTAITGVPTGRWLFHAGNLLGRVRGSLRHRCWYV